MRCLAFGLVGEHGPASMAWLLVLAEAGHFVAPLSGKAAEHPAKLRELADTMGNGTGVIEPLWMAPLDDPLLLLTVALAFGAVAFAFAEPT